MRPLRNAVLVLAVFVGIGLLVDRVVVGRSAQRNAPGAQVRLAAAMAGLFAGGAVGSVLALAMAFRKRS